MSSTLYIDNIYNKAGNGGPNFSNGITTSNVNGGQIYEWNEETQTWDLM